MGDGQTLVMPAAVFETRVERLLSGLTDADLAEGYAAFATEDYQIGYRAFLAKEKPRFEGR